MGHEIEVGAVALVQPHGVHRHGLHLTSDAVSGLDLGREEVVALVDLLTLVDASDIGALVGPVLQAVEQPVLAPGVDGPQVAIKLRPHGFRGAVVSGPASV